MDHTGEFPMRPVRPIDSLPEALADALPAEDRGDRQAPSRPEALLVDPLTRRPVGPSMSAREADAIERVFAGIGERGAAELASTRKAVSELRSLFNDASQIAGDLRSVAYLFIKAVVEDGGNTPLTAASHLVVDLIESMAKRLDLLETQAEVLAAPIFAAEPRR